MLEIDNCVSVHERNLKVLAVEMYKVYMSSSKKVNEQDFPFETANSILTKEFSIFLHPASEKCTLEP